MGMHASTVIVSGADRGVRRALTAEPPNRGVREWGTGLGAERHNGSRRIGL